MTPKPNHDEQTERADESDEFENEVRANEQLEGCAMPKDFRLVARRFFNAGYQAGKREGSEERRKAVLLIVEAVKTDHHQRYGRADGYDLDTCDEIAARISEEKNDGE